MTVILGMLAGLNELTYVTQFSHTGVLVTCLLLLLLLISLSSRWQAEVQEWQTPCASEFRDTRGGGELGV